MGKIDAQGNIHDRAGRYAEKQNSAPAGLTLAGSIAPPYCEAHGGEWGSDEWCATCTTIAGDVKPVPLDLQEPEPDSRSWGEVRLTEKSRTPWGTPQDITDVAPGIAVVSTAGHGGVKLSPERNAQIPIALRNSSGWYEEDCEYNIPARYFPAEFAHQPHLTDRHTADSMRESAEQSIMEWFPEKWEAANGRELQPGESRVKDEKAWALAHMDVPIATSACSAKSDPEMVVVTAQNGGHDGDRSTVAQYLVPRSEYRAGRGENDEPGRAGRFVVDPARHPKLPMTPPPAHKPPARIVIPEERVSASALSQAYIDGAITATARDRIAKDMNQCWRRADGSIETVRDILEAGVKGKTAYQDGASMQYAILQTSPDGKSTFSLKVSKATWDYLDTVPDMRSDAERAQQSAYQYQTRLDNKFVATPEERREADRRYAEARRLRELEEAERTAREGTPAERDKRGREAQAARERAAIVTT